MRTRFFHHWVFIVISVCLQKIKIFLFVVAVVVLFFISWLPFHIQRLGYHYFKDNYTFRTINEYLFYISGFLYYLSSTLNPVLYNLMSTKYRKAFKAQLCSFSTHPVVMTSQDT